MSQRENSNSCFTLAKYQRLVQNYIINTFTFNNNNNKCRGDYYSEASHIKTGKNNAAGVKCYCCCCLSHNLLINQNKSHLTWFFSYNPTNERNYLSQNFCKNFFPLLSIVGLSRWLSNCLTPLSLWVCVSVSVCVMMSKGRGLRESPGLQYVNVRVGREEEEIIWLLKNISSWLTEW